MIDKYIAKKRNNSRRLVLDSNLASDLWAFLKPYIHSMLEENEISCVPLGFDVLRGEWQLDGLNEAFRVNKYCSEKIEFFSPHRDAQYCPNGDHRSILTLLIYANDDFSGGETIFYFPKVSENSDFAKEQIFLKDQTIQEEIDKQSGLEKGYLKFTVNPSIGRIVVFSQNVLHESSPVQGGTKISIKSDVLAKRINKMYGFAVCQEEREDYRKCLDYFRRAQTYELNGYKEKAGVLYGRALSIRYCYPNALQKEEEDCTQTSNNNDYCTFPTVVWHSIFHFLSGVDIESVVRAFPVLWSTRKDWEMRRCLKDKNIDEGNPLYIPEIVLHDGMTTCFKFCDSVFFEENEESCVRVAALYAFYLLGHKVDEKFYTVRYDPDTQEGTAVALKSLLLDAFLNRPCYGAIYAVNQADECHQNPKLDFHESVDRTYMSLRHNAQFVGTPMKENMTVKVKWPHIKESDLDKLIAKMANSDSEEDTSDKDSNISDDSDTEGVVKMFKDAIMNSIEKTLSSIDDPVEHFVYGYDTEFSEFSSFPVVLKDVTSWEHLDGEIISGTFDEDTWFEKSNVINPQEGPTCDNSSAVDLYFRKTVEVVNENPAVSATLVSKLKKPVEIDGNLCFCYWPGGEGYSQIDKSCQTKCYNHLVFDFSTHQMAVVKEELSKQDTGEFPDKEDGGCPEREEHCPFYNIPFFGCTEEDLGGLIDIRRYRVDLLPLLKQAYPFNHASCNCYVPSFTITECQNLLDYPILNHVHVVGGVKSGTNEVLLWVIYGGIVAL